MAGHPTIGTHVRARARRRDRTRAASDSCSAAASARCRSTLTWKGDDLGFAWMTQPLPAFGEPLPDPARPRPRCRCRRRRSRAPACRCRSCRAACRFCSCRSTTRSAVDSAVGATRRLLDELLRAGEHRRRTASSSSRPSRATDARTVYSRMFAPELGVVEDPATGIASGPLGCYLVRHKFVPPREGGRDDQPAGREDGPPEPRAHLDRRRARARSPASASAAKRCWRARVRCMCRRN